MVVGWEGGLEFCLSYCCVCVGGCLWELLGGVGGRFLFVVLLGCLGEEEGWNWCCAWGGYMDM